MSARQKLNLAYFHGALILAALIGMAAQSWAIFWVALIVLTAGGCYAGEIRFRRQR
jgi:hypothetical protein